MLVARALWGVGPGTTARLAPRRLVVSTSVVSPRSCTAPRQPAATAHPHPSPPSPHPGRQRRPKHKATCPQFCHLPLLWKRAAGCSFIYLFIHMFLYISIYPYVSLFIWGPDGVAEWVEHPPPVLEDHGIRRSRVRVRTLRIRFLVESNQWL